MRFINEIIIHCSATKVSQDIGVADIKKWHVEGNGWKDIGYHFVIRRDGTLESGRDISVSGAHCGGHNSKTIGICLVGGLDDGDAVELNFTIEQFSTLTKLIIKLKSEYDIQELSGHNEYSSKACPCFDVKPWAKERGL